jgi:hypothetical protein
LCIPEQNEQGVFLALGLLHRAQLAVWNGVDDGWRSLSDGRRCPNGEQPTPNLVAGQESAQADARHHSDQEREGQPAEFHFNSSQRVNR